MKYLSIVLLISVIYSQDVQQVSETKRDVAYGQDCDDTEYRNEWGTPNWKNYGVWLSECDSIRSVTLDKEFTERRKKQQREKAIQDSIEAEEYKNIDFVFNPEFLTERKARLDFINTSRIVLGSNKPEALDVVEKLYRIR